MTSSPHGLVRHFTKICSSYSLNNNFTNTQAHRRSCPLPAFSWLALRESLGTMKLLHRYGVKGSHDSSIVDSGNVHG